MWRTKPAVMKFIFIRISMRILKIGHLFSHQYSKKRLLNIHRCKDGFATVRLDRVKPNNLLWHSHNFPHFMNIHHSCLCIEIKGSKFTQPTQPFCAQLHHFRRLVLTQTPMPNITVRHSSHGIAPHMCPMLLAHSSIRLPRNIEKQLTIYQSGSIYEDEQLRTTGLILRSQLLDWIGRDDRWRRGVQMRGFM